MAAFINAQSPALWLSSGDYVANGFLAEYETIWQPFRELVTAPFRGLCGNHDTPSGEHVYLRFVCDLLDVRLIGFHTYSQVPSTNGAIYQTELAWLEEQLAAAAAAGKRIIAITHHPPFTIGSYTFADDTTLRDLLTEYGVKVCLYGHIQAAANAQELGGCTYIDGSSLGFLGSSITKNGLMLVTVYADRADFDWRMGRSPFSAYDAESDPSYTPISVDF